jgi:hypothetical protein
LAFTTDADGLQALVAEQIEVPKSTGFYLINREGEYTVQADAEDNAMRKPWHRWENTNVRVTYDSGERCMARSGPLGFLVQLVPHPADEAFFTGKGPHGEKAHEPLLPAEVAREIWERANSFQVSVPLQLHPGEQCKGHPLFAARAEREAFTIYDRVEVIPKRGFIMAQIRQLDYYKSTIAAFTRAEAKAGRSAVQEEWEKRFTLEAFQKKGERSVYISVRSPPKEPCGDSADIWLVFRLLDGKLRTEKPPGEAPGNIQLVLDIDGDGAPEYLVGDPRGHGKRLIGRDQRVIHAWSAERQDCPC